MKMPWFVFKMAPPELEKVLKKGSPEGSGCIFDEKKQFPQMENT